MHILPILEVVGMLRLVRHMYNYDDSGDEIGQGPLHKWCMTSLSSDTDSRGGQISC